MIWLLYNCPSTSQEMNMQIRLANPGDAEAILGIYSDYCSTPTTFELEPPTLGEQERRIREGLLKYPWLVAVEQNQILGYAYASAFRPRKAWQWSTETSVYVAKSSQQRGVGSALYERLLSILKSQGFVSVIAAITLPNPASVRLHEFFKFEQVGAIRNGGYKCETWYDVSFFQLTLNSPQSVPKDPLGLSEIAD
jgi:L-amino acid N-acyltransferase YncA